MEKEFKYEIWDLPSYIAELETSTKYSGEELLENVSGGTMNKKLKAGFLAGITALTATPSITNPTAIAMQPTSATITETKKQDVNLEITKEQAIEDINYVLKVIKHNHVSAVEKVPDEVTNQAKIEIENLKDKVSAIDEWRIISRILAKLHDAHTKPFYPRIPIFKTRLPFGKKYENGKFICTSGEFKNCEITAINDISIPELYRIFQSHFSHEIEEWTECNFFEVPSGFIPSWKLALCGIDVSKPVKVSFNTRSGIQSKSFELTEIETPNENSEHWVSYEIDENNSIGIFKLNSCRFNDEYKKILLNFLKEVSEKKIKNIAIDLRKNVGGDSRVANMFAASLKKISGFKCDRYDERSGDKLLLHNGHTMNKDEIEKLRIEHLGENYDKNLLFGGNLFLLTSHCTFSSAELFADMFQSNHLATIVGEVPGNSPEHFGNLVSEKDGKENFITKHFKTPNSDLTFVTTCKKFYRIDETKDGTKLIPDVQVPAKDALKKVYEIIDEERN